MEKVLQQRLRHDVPQGAVFMTQNEVLRYQLELIDNWKPWTDIWPLHLGRTILAGAASISGVYINYRFRRKLRFLDYGSFPTTISLFLIPASLTAIAQGEFFTKKLLLLDTRCSLCLETRSILLQNLTGLITPMVFTPLANFSIAPGSTVVNIPPGREVKAAIKLIGSVYQPLLPVITSIFIFHSLLAGFISYEQIKSFIYLQNAQYLLVQSDEQDRKYKK